MLPTFPMHKKLSGTCPVTGSSKWLDGAQLSRSWFLRTNSENNLIFTYLRKYVNYVKIKHCIRHESLFLVPTNSVTIFIFLAPCRLIPSRKAAWNKPCKWSTTTWERKNVECNHKGEALLLHPMGGMGHGREMDEWMAYIGPWSRSRTGVLGCRRVRHYCFNKEISFR